MRLCLVLDGLLGWAPCLASRHGRHVLHVQPGHLHEATKISHGLPQLHPRILHQADDFGDDSGSGNELLMVLHGVLLEALPDLPLLFRQVHAEYTVPAFTPTCLCTLLAAENSPAAILTGHSPPDLPLRALQISDELGIRQMVLQSPCLSCFQAAPERSCQASAETVAVGTDLALAATRPRSCSWEREYACFYGSYSY